MTAQVFVLPTPSPLDLAPHGSLATWGDNLYARGSLGWYALTGTPHWTRHLDHEAVLIREGL